MTGNTASRNQLLIRAAELRRMADELEALAAHTEAPQASELLDLAKLRTEFGFSRESLQSAAQHGLAVHRGPRGRLCAFREDVVMWVRSRAWKPRAHQEDTDEGAALARAEAELLSLSGLRTRQKREKSHSTVELTETMEVA